jgi:nitrogen-specific signal transduction histidine kinase
MVLSVSRQRGYNPVAWPAVQVIREHGGRVAVESESGRGTAFHVFLPISREETQLAPD